MGLLFILLDLELSIMSKHVKKSFSSDYYLGLCSILVAAFFWGTAGAAASFAKELQPIAIATISVGIGGLIHTFLSLNAIRQNLSQLKQFKTKIALAVIVSILCPLSFYSSVAMAGVSIGTVLAIGCAPLFSVLLEWGIDKHKFSFKWLISFILGLTGVILLSHTGSIGHEENSLQSERMIGIFFGLLSSFSYASYSWIMKNLIGQGVDSRAAMGFIFGISAVLVLPTLFITGQNLFTYPENIMVAIYIPLVPMFLGYLFFSFGLKRIPASQAMTLALVEIPVATLLAVFLVGEILTYTSYLGLFLIFLCVIVLSRK